MPRKPPRRHALADLAPTPDAPDETRGAPPAPASPAPTVAPTAPREPTAIGEVLGFPPAWLAALPMPTTLWLRTADGAELVATTARRAHAALRAARVPVITGRELGMLAVGAENDRCSHEAVGRWLASGGGAPNGPGVVSVAYGGAYALETPNHRWPLGKVLDAWGLTLANVAVGDVGEMEVLGGA